MAHHAMIELEQASHIILAPPNLVTSEQRHAAENVILSFRKTKLPYTTCKYIMENSKIDYVLFQGATTIKEAIVREWTLLSAEDVESLRSFLLRYITKNISLQSYVREQVLQTVAVILKRSTLDTKGTTCDSLFQDVTQLIGSGNVTMQLVACSMLTALLNEYSSSSRTSSVGFTWEFHIRCKRAFEEHDLKKVFMFCLQVLHEIDQEPNPLTREAIAVLNRVLSIAEQVLCWEFTPKTLVRKHIGSFESNQNITLRPNETWRSTLLDADMLNMFFKIHKKARHNSEMAHHSMQCLSQLASLNGSVFADDKAKTQYLTVYTDGFLQLLQSIDLQDYENLGVANSFKNLVMMFPISSFMSLPPGHFQAFIDCMTRLTCSLGRQAALEELVNRDETIHMEGYEKMLETWMQLVPDLNQMPAGALKPHATEVFNSYVQCHISAPDGVRTATSCSGTDDDEEIDEIEEDDRDRFQDQLCCVGTLGRLIPEHSIPLLAKVLEDRVSRLHGQLQRFQQQRSSIGLHDATIDMSILTVLHEDIHWLILAAAHVLTEESEGETPMIPSEIMEYSISQSTNINIHTTLKVLASPGEWMSSIPGSEQCTDNVVRLISAVFRLCEVETRAVNVKLTDCLSPQVGRTAMWFLSRWARVYLLPDENFYSQISMALSAAFGRDTEGAQWTIGFLLQKVISNLTVWSAEEKFMEDTLQLLVALVDHKTRASYVVKSDLLWNLAKMEATNDSTVSVLTSTCRRLLTKALVLAGSGFNDSTLREEYWKIVLQSIHDRFYSLVCNKNFTKLRHTGEVKEDVIVLLETLLGIAEGSRVDNLDRMFLFLSPLLAESVKLLDVYHSYEDVVPLILELFSEVVNRHLCYLGETKSQKLYDLCLSVIQMYSKHNSGKRVMEFSDEEENKYNDILIVMELLTNLLSKDFIDFGESEEGVPQGGGQMSAADVVLYGLNIIVPLMNEELLKFPSLCSQYFKLVSFLGEVHPDKFTSLPADLFKTLMGSVELGLSIFGPDITKMCLEIIASLASHIFQTNITHSYLLAALSHFLKLVFHMLLLESFDMDLLETASCTFFCLICCHQDQYRDLVNQLLQNQMEPDYKQRLLEAFNNLTPPTLNMTINRHSKITFMHNFDQFLINVRAFLCVK
ncbi:exportin-4-like [Gigantopelta aegis]|uniref:exportin-4-like n=1 Tax=Gigantopelta aegis TaxID=1735272 RepID=UPI001B888D62|nr:exportin-4-like [Gigantopelta aegis]